MTMKILWEKESKRLLGAQIIGADGVDKRIDIHAASMAAGMTVSQLAELDLAYAPPYAALFFGKGSRQYGRLYETVIKDRSAAEEDCLY